MIVEKVVSKNLKAVNSLIPLNYEDESLAGFSANLIRN